MIPFRDNIKSRTYPFVNIALIVINVAAFLYELSLGPALDAFIFQYGVVPVNVFSWPESDATVAAVAIPFLTSIFLHGGWLHLIGNMWYLWIFGDNVEDRVGHFNYLLFYLLAGLGAGIVHTALNANTTIPSVGASGAIAGVLGAYLVSYPFARVLTLVPLFIFMQVIEIPAFIVLAAWFFIQFINGAGALAVAGPADTGGVAWWAHIGGFVIGMLLIGLFPRRGRQPNLS